MKAIEEKEIINFVRQRNFVLLQITRSPLRLHLECPQKHQFWASWSNFKHRNSGCKKCAGLATSKNQKLPYESVCGWAMEKGQKVLTSKEDYLKNHHKKQNKLKIQCLCGIKYKTAREIRDSFCLKCQFKTGYRVHTGKNSKEKVKQTVETRGYEWIEQDYVDQLKKIEVKCKKHGLFKIRYNDLSQGHGCQKCGQTTSICEKEIADFIASLGVKVEVSKKDIIKPYELDIFLPQLKIAIEYCGLRWHSERFKKGRSYHYNKHRMCLDLGIQLITIFEHEWEDKKNIVKNTLKSKILQNKINSIGARKTQCRIIDKQTANNYLKDNHINGKSVNSVLCVGLFSEEVLIGCLTVSRHHRDSGSYIISRVCFKDSVVLGGFAKMLKTVKEWCLLNKIEKIITWSDNRWSNGNMYLQNGFLLDKELPPDYFYVENDKIIHSKQSCKKQNLIKKGASGNTEKELAASLDYYRVWDCGKKRWVLNLNHTKV